LHEQLREQWRTNPWMSLDGMRWADRADRDMRAKIGARAQAR